MLTAGASRMFHEALAGYIAESTLRRKRVQQAFLVLTHMFLLCNTVSHMITQDTKRRFNWKTVLKDTRQTRWVALYVSLNEQGHFRLSRMTHELMGGPEAYNIVFDPDEMVIGLAPARAADRNAYEAHIRGKNGGRIIFGRRLINDFHLYVPQTMVFHRAYIDNAGTLILDLKDFKGTRNRR